MPSRPIARRCSFRQHLLALAIAAAASAPIIASCAEEGFDDPRLLREKSAELTRIGAISLSPFQPAGVSSRIRRTLLQFDALIADSAWSEAIELIERLQNESGSELTKLPAPSADSSPLGSPEGHTLYVPLAARCQQLLAALDDDGVAEYRDRVNRTARDRLNEGTRRLDEDQLQQVVDEFLASEPAGEALLALGELAIERGDGAAARRSMNRLHPLLSGPYGRPAGVTLALFRLDADPAEVATAWQASLRAEKDAVAPADDALMPLALSRLALTSLREGDLRRAEAETRLLRGLAPDAVGRLAGREQPLADALQAMIDAERSSASQRKDDSVPTYRWAWSAPIPVKPPTPPPTQRVNNRARFQINGRNQLQILQQLTNPQPPTPAVPTFANVVCNGLDAFHVEQNELKRLNLATGETKPFKLPGFESDEPDDTPRPALGDIAANGFAFGNGAAIQLGRGQGVVVRGSGPATRIDPSLAIADGVLYARVVRVTPSRRNVRNAPSTTEEVLLGKPIDADDVATVRFLPPQSEPGPAKPGVAGYQFAGPPTVVGDRLYIALARPGVRTEVSIACYAAETGRRLWTTDVGAGEPISRTGAGTDLPVTLVGDTVYAATNLGAVAALEASTGKLRWIACYPRDREPTFTRPGMVPTLSPHGCVVAGDRVIAAPGDSTRLLAWDAGTGRPLWDAERGDIEAEISGVSKDPDGAVVLLSGRQVTAYDSLTGERRFEWPESRRAGLRGVGNAALVGGELFWPTAGVLYALDSSDGRLTRPPIDLSSLGSDGASVVRTDFGPLVCGPKRLRLLAELPEDDETVKSEPQARVSRLMGTRGP